MTPEMAGWIRSRPACVQALMRRFPPLCLVRANVPLLCPMPGEVVPLRGYGENGEVSVQRGAFVAMCEPEWLEVVSYEPGFSPADVAAVLDAAEHRGEWVH